MNIVNFLIFFIPLAAVILTGLYFLLKYFLGEKGTKENNDSSLLLIQNQLNEISRNLDFRLSESTKLVHSHLEKSIKIIKDITQELTKVGEGQKQVVDIGKQLENLQDILKNPKQRGILGEYFLETVLKNVLPPNTYQIQYEFKDGLIVDAVIFIKDRLIPIDSKFSLENYNRILESQSDGEKLKFETAFRDNLKTRIDETAKYIKPEEGTYDFAFMFIPSEAIYYDLLINKVGTIKSNTRDLIQYAAGEKKVMIVSPTTFLAYLQTVLQGLKALQIEESAKEIRKRVEELGRHLSSYESYMKKLGTHLETTVNMYNSAYKELGKIDKDVLKISGISIETQQMTLEKPTTFEE